MSSRQSKRGTVPPPSRKITCVPWFGGRWTTPTSAMSSAASRRIPSVELRRDGRERAHGGRVSVGWDGDVILCGPAIDAGGSIRVNALEECRAGGRLLPVATLRVLHGRLLLTDVVDGASGTGMPRTAILLNGITRGAACHHCSRHRIPWARLGNGLTSTSERVGHGPGGSAHGTSRFVPGPVSGLLSRDSIT